MRAFIGIKLNDVLNDIINLQNMLKIKEHNANYTLEDNIHLTLSFLGEINLEQIETIKDILNKININSFVLKITKVKKMKDMIILEIEQNHNLINLQKNIELCLLKNGFNLENRRYYPHITLARKTSQNIEKTVSIISKIRECALFSSERVNNRLTYIPVYVKPFNDNV